jgi:hypothetical protein
MATTTRYVSQDTIPLFTNKTTNTKSISFYRNIVRYDEGNKKRMGN